MVSEVHVSLYVLRGNMAPHPSQTSSEITRRIYQAEWASVLNYVTAHVYRGWYLFWMDTFA